MITAADVERTASGWEVSPQDMVTLLERITRYYRPAELYITENGSSYEDFVNEDARSPTSSDAVTWYVTWRRSTTSSQRAFR